MESKIFNYLKNDETVLERSPLEKICKLHKLGAYKRGSSAMHRSIRQKI